MVKSKECTVVDEKVERATRERVLLLGRSAHAVVAHHVQHEHLDAQRREVAHALEIARRREDAKS